jgi:hypothetical protein
VAQVLLAQLVEWVVVVEQVEVGLLRPRPQLDKDGLGGVEVGGELLPDPSAAGVEVGVVVPPALVHPLGQLPFARH